MFQGQLQPEFEVNVRDMEVLATPNIKLCVSSSDFASMTDVFHVRFSIGITNIVSAITDIIINLSITGQPFTAHCMNSSQFNGSFCIVPRLRD